MSNWLGNALRGVFILFAAAIGSSVRAQDVPKDEAAFAEYVAAQLRRELNGAQVEVTGPLTLVVGGGLQDNPGRCNTDVCAAVGGGLQANLGRIFTYCSNNAADGCRSEISTFVKGFAQPQTPPSRDAVRIIVRTSAYVRGTNMQWRPLAGELVMLPVNDAPLTVHPLTQKDNVQLGLSADEVFNLGLANLRDRLKPLMQVAKVAQPGQILYIEGDVYASSRLALHESWSQLARAQGGKLIVAAPEKTTVIYVADETPAATKALRTMTQKVMSLSPHPLSSELLRWTTQGWEVVP
jgi:hypothetical protein